MLASNNIAYPIFSGGPSVPQGGGYENLGGGQFRYIAPGQSPSAGGIFSPAQPVATPPSTVRATAPAVTPSANSTGTASLFQPGYLGAPVTYNASTATAPNPQAVFSGAVPTSQGGSSSAVGSNAAQYDLGTLFGEYSGPAQLSSGLTGSLGAGATIDQLLQGFAPQEQNAQNQLNQTLADFGIGGGQAIGEETQFQGNQAAALAPSITSAIQNSQANLLNAGEFDTGAVNTSNAALNSFLASALGQDTSNQQSTNQFNASNLLQNNQFNASQEQQNNQFNADNILQNNQFNATQGQQSNDFNAANQNTDALANASAATSASAANAQAQNQTNAANVGEQNVAQQQLINDLLNQYYAQLGDFQQINTGGQSAGNQNAVNFGQEVTVTPNPFTTIFGEAASAL